MFDFFKKKTVKVAVAAGIIGSSLGYFLRDCAQFAQLEKDPATVKKIEKVEKIIQTNIAELEKESKPAFFKKQMDVLNDLEPEIPLEWFKRLKKTIDNLREDIHYMEKKKIEADAAAAQGDIRTALLRIDEASVVNLLVTFENLLDDISEVKRGRFRSTLPKLVEPYLIEIIISISDDLKSERNKLEAMLEKNKKSN